MSDHAPSRSVEETARDFIHRALAAPAVPLERAREELAHEPLLRARAHVDLLIASDAATRAAAASLDDEVMACASEMVVRDDARGEPTLVEESLANAVLPLAHALLVRDAAMTHPEVRPLLELAHRVVPP